MLDQGTVGLITYMRTDATRVANEAIGCSQGDRKAIWVGLSSAKPRCIRAEPGLRLPMSDSAYLHGQKTGGYQITFQRSVSAVSIDLGKIHGQPDGSSHPRYRSGVGRGR